MMEYLNINAGLLNEYLEDIPDEYMIVLEGTCGSIPVKSISIDDESKEVILKAYSDKEEWWFVNVKVEDAIVKRLIKMYLTVNKTATARMITKHIYDNNYGLQKTYTPSSLGKKITEWNKTSRTWFNIESYHDGKNKWYYIKE